MFNGYADTEHTAQLLIKTSCCDHKPGVAAESLSTRARTILDNPARVAGGSLQRAPGSMRRQEIPAQALG